MKIEVWSDFVCPFCYIGKRRLEEALAQFPQKDQVEVEFKSFELDPNSPKNIDKSIHEVLAGKYGMSLEQAKQANQGVGQQAAGVGLTYHFDTMKPTNTFDAHRLAKFAKTRGKEAEVTEKLLYAYFTDSKHIGDHDTLADIAAAAGIDREETLKVLQDQNAYANDVRIDESIAQQYGISGVPYFVINQKYAISGAQPTATFSGALQQVWQEESASPVLQDLSTENAEDASCADGSCAIPERKE
ncbi:DsbA family oxidoreductase [Neobacillus ginsengisoli]|uniref:DsbA family dithiol-disulfide isomerase n=1 Tax=Neobacillus ginsengisoli TaxID=904295 RepID=A0ABT9XQT0_9BACI|nr:DsbA family oxidoreductase [Neobacillus ginsengisoli]MDQ0197905.1 putative DsbA family dithiol-disulfide isomerase [Neobacillus ginsengisoli]